MKQASLHQKQHELYELVTTTDAPVILAIASRRWGKSMVEQKLAEWGAALDRSVLLVTVSAREAPAQRGGTVIPLDEFWMRLQKYSIGSLVQYQPPYLVILDEAAFMNDQRAAWVYRTLRMVGVRLLLLTTPAREDDPLVPNWFRLLWEQTADDPEVIHFVGGIAPFISDQQREEFRQQVSEAVYHAEMLGEFVTPEL